ncbi:type II secretion system protein [Candidatus Saccharibacteria bacterium]|nr:type II secretion system protein [Candidatus Saccharibacteria bacterium]
MNTKSKKGFTIIEVVLVLAIAGLIFLMVFIALPNMQRSQRDTQRRNDYAALSAAMTQYITNNNGNLPSSLSSTDSVNYINESGKDPNGLTYDLKLKVCASGSDKCGISVTEMPAKATRDNATVVFVVKNAICDDTVSPSVPKYVKSNRAYAVFGQTEAGTGTYCQSNN